MTEQRLGVML